MAHQGSRGPIVSEWWLPGEPREDAVPGSYETQEHGNAVAVLHRPLGSESFMFSSEHYPLLHGTAFGKPITLVDARIPRTRMGVSARLAEIEVRPRISIEGLLLDFDELTMTEARVRIQRQDDWIRPRTFNMEREAGDTFIRGVSYNTFPEVEAPISDGTVSIRDFSTYRESGNDVTVTSRTGFHFRFSRPVHLEDFITRHLRAMQVFMTLATGTQCGVESLKFTDCNWRIEGAPDGVHRWVEARMWAPSPKNLGRRDDSLFDFRDFDWANNASRVFDLSETWGYAIEMWALLLDDRFIWPIARFATAASAVEALDRILHPDQDYQADTELRDRVLAALAETTLGGRDRRKVKKALSRPNEKSLHERIKRLAALAPEATADVVNEPMWAERVARLRHVVSHGLQATEEFSRDVRSVQCGTEILLHLLESAFLLHIGFTSGQLTTVRRRYSRTEHRKMVVRECIDLLPQVNAS